MAANPLKRYELTEISQSRLRDWVLIEVDKFGLAGLGRRLSMTHGAVSAWRDGRIASIRPESIEAIARHKGETTEQVLGWLGLEPKVPEPIPITRLSSAEDLSDFLDRSSRTTLFWLMSECLDRLKIELECIQQNNEVDSMTIPRVRRFAWLQLSGAGIDLNTQAGLDRVKDALFRLFDQEDGDRILSFLKGGDRLDEDDVPALAWMLRDLTGKKFTQRELLDLKNAPHNCGGH